MYGGSRAYVAHHMRQWDERAKTLQAAFLQEVGPDFPLPWPTTGANPRCNVRACSRVLYLQLVRAYAARRLTLDIVPGEGFLGICGVRLPEAYRLAHFDHEALVPTIRGAGGARMPRSYAVKIWHRAGLVELPGLDTDGCVRYAYRPEKRARALATVRRACKRRNAVLTRPRPPPFGVSATTAFEPVVAGATKTRKRSLDEGASSSSSTAAA